MNLILGPIFALVVGLVLFGLLWLNLLSLPGNWLMLCVLCLLAWLWPQGGVGWAFVGAMALLALLGEAMELGAQVIGARRGGASHAGNFGGVVGSIVGAVLGMAFGPLGGLAGALLGAWVGCFAVERMRQETSQKAAEAAWGAFWGRSLGLVGKAACGAAIIVMSVVKLMGAAA